MKLTVTGRHIEITEGIKDHLNQKIEKTLPNMGDDVDLHIALAVFCRWLVWNSPNSFNRKSSTIQFLKRFWRAKRKPTKKPNAITTQKTSTTIIQQKKKPIPMKISKAPGKSISTKTAFPNRWRNRTSTTPPP